MLKIGDLELKSKYILAPLAGFTDFAFRALCYELGSGLCFTEMVSSKGLVYSSEKTKDFLYTTPMEYIKAVQIFGENAEIMARSIEEYLEDFDLIDINMGCPVPKLFKNGEGSALLSDIKKAEKIIQACVKTGKNISVKFRIGIDGEHIVTEDFAKMIEGAGAVMMTVHGRTRADFYSGQPNYREIEKAVNVVKIPVIANGGVFSKSDSDKMLRETGASGVMIARGALERPWIFTELLGNVFQGDIKELIFKHLDLLKTRFSDRDIAINFRKQAALYVKGVIGSKKYKNEIFKAESTSEMKEIIGKIYG